MTPVRILSLMVLLLSLASGFQLFADDEKTATKTDKPEKKKEIPAETDTWTIMFDGSGGTPGDRSNYRWSLKHDGTLEYQTGRGRDKLGPKSTIKLTDEERHKVYVGVCKVINDHKKENEVGRAMDGLYFSLAIESNTAHKSVDFSKMSHVKDASPEFATIYGNLRLTAP